MPPPDFPLDRFQRDAIAALDEGRSVLVAAPTGAGKTVVADAAVDLALSAGGRVFYTTPIKALSNQKFRDLRERLGEHRVGLLTGDTALGADAPVVVMTTEVLRNMIYARSPALGELHYVVLDEVHYLQDAYRGPVWEEVIIHLPSRVGLVCLSATVSNVEELGAWLEAVRGPTSVVVETERPVELHPCYLVGDRHAELDHLVPLLVDGRPNPEGHRFTEDPRLARRRGGRLRRRFRTPRRTEVIERLDEEDLLPAIHFIFSRRGCDEAVADCLDAGLRFTDPEERSAIRRLAEERVEALSDADLDALDYDRWLEALSAGIAAHHAGLVPAFKEVVEDCFSQGLVRVVFATETLALGINMPARTVVIERLTKYNGETHEMLTPAEFTQLTGRAGRRGIDDAGTAVVLWSPFVTFDQVATLAASRSFPLRSAFRPTYNMAANLVRRHPRAEAMATLARSFAQFQADRASAGLQARLADDRRRLASLDDQARCELGDVGTYAAARRRLERARRRAAASPRAVERSLALLRPGDVVDLHQPVEGRFVLLSVAHRGKGAIRLRGVGTDGAAVQVDGRGVNDPVHPVAHLELPSPYAPRDPSFLAACGRALSAVEVPTRPPSPPAAVAEEPLREVEAHPVHACPERDAHLEALDRRGRVRREVTQVEAAVARRAGSVPRRFEAVIDLLSGRGMVAGWSLTPAGERLAGIYHESDLLVAEALREGLLDGLPPAELAATVSCVTYEERRPDPPRARRPVPEVGRRATRLAELATALRGEERSRGLPMTREPDDGFAAAAHAWVAGEELTDVLTDEELPAGDFVRNIRVLVDLLGQVALLAPDPSTRASAAAAVSTALRGVVAASSDPPSVSP